MPLTIPYTKPRQAPLEVVVTVFDLTANEEIRRHEFNYNNKTKRLWLQKLCVWAWCNGHSVEMYNKIDITKAEG